MLAAVIITKNEEKNIVRCLESVRFCDEIIVVDSESTDQTVQLAAKLNARVFTVPWRGYVDQRNYANLLTTAEWILSIDADEEVSIDLRDEILEKIESHSSSVAYSVPRRTMYSGRWIRHGGWYPNRLVRLFKKTQGQWVGGDLHEYWSLNSSTTGTLGELTKDLIHYSFADIFDQVHRNNRYSSLGALTLQKSGRPFSSVRLLTKPVSKFLETYLLKGGFLDGYRGFIISVSASYSVFLKWAKLWELNHNESQQ